MGERMRDIQLPDNLCEAAEKAFGHRFSGVGPLLEFVLRELLRDESAVLDQIEQGVIEQRLRELGYL
jgi:hypothetical protein